MSNYDLNEETSGVEETPDMKTDEDDSKEGESQIPIRYNLNSYGWDVDVEGLVRRLKRDDIVIPDFQRKEVWTKKQQSSFIESLILGIPIPTIFLSQDPVTSKLNIIDGLQRLITLRDYFEGKFSLQGDGIRDELKSCFFDEEKRRNVLEEDDQRKLRNAIIHAVVIKDSDSNPDGDTEQEYSEAIIQIFKRINTAGTPLTRQEIRACIYHGELMKKLKELNRDENWRALFKKDSEDSRLRDTEIILRFIALFDSFENYKSPMPQFLDNYMKENRKWDECKQESISKLFLDSVKKIHDSCGASIFRPSNTFHVAKFDSVMVGLAKRLERNPEISSEDIKEATYSLFENEDFKEYVKEFTNEATRVKGRVSTSIKIFEDK